MLFKQRQLVTGLLLILAMTTWVKLGVHAMQVGDALLDVIFDPDVADGSGLVIDGFPRTALQVRGPMHSLASLLLNSKLTR